MSGSSVYPARASMTPVKPEWLKTVQVRLVWAPCMRCEAEANKWRVDVYYLHCAEQNGKNVKNERAPVSAFKPTLV